MDQLRRRYRIAGALAGAAVFVVMLLGGQGLVAALIFGAMVALFMGAVLVWGLAEGRGTAEENAALAPRRWEAEPFAPARRIVAPGGAVVSHEALPAAALPGAPAAEAVTLRAARLGDEPLPVAAAVPDPAPERDFGPVPEGVTPGQIVDLTDEPEEEEADALAPAWTDTALDALPGGTAGKSERKAGKKAKKAAKKARKAGKGPGTGGLDQLIDRVATVTDAHEEMAPAAEAMPVAADPAPAVTAPAGPPAFAPAPDDLLSIRGIGPMERDWLAGYGVTTLAAIAAWDEADIARFAGMMGVQGHRIRTEDWAGQAARLTGATR